MEGTEALFSILYCISHVTKPSFKSSMLATARVTDRIKANGDHSNHNLKENENDNNPFQLLAVRGRQVLLEHIQQVADDGRPLVQELDALANFQVSYRAAWVETQTCTLG